MLDEIITAAEEGKFSDFSKKVKQSLNDKLRNNPKFQDAKNQFLQNAKIKDAMATLNKELGKK